MKRSITTLLFVAALGGMAGVAQAVPVSFTTNAAFGTPGPYPVPYVSVYLDGDTVPACTTDATGDCIGSAIDLPAGLHSARYELRNSTGSVLGSVKHFASVPASATSLVIRIPTVRVRWYTDPGVGVALNGHLFAGATSGGVVTANVLSGCYTTSYHKYYPTPPVPWPAPLPAEPDPSLVGFDGLCVGASNSYPAPTGDNPADTDPPHVRINVPSFGAPNTAPVVTSFTVTAPNDSGLYPINSTLEVAAAFDDTGGSADDPYTCMITWEEGLTENDGVYQYLTDPLYFGSPCTGSYPYTVPGVYTLHATITDKYGASGGADRIVVVYDPSAGFVTGGGWIDSPAGAYKVDPSMIGQANFGFVSKYKKGATVPDGNTQFVFEAGDLSFHSSTYEWLVVSGGKAQFKGVGTINGVGSFGFLLTATDAALTSTTADVDMFRIKIWDRSNGDTVVYDNGVEQPLGGGSIVIHTGGRK